MTIQRPKPPANFDDNPPLDADFWRRARPALPAAALAQPSLRTAIAELERANEGERESVANALDLLRKASLELERVTQS